MEKKDRLARAFSYAKMEGIIKSQKHLASVMHADEATVSKAMRGDARYLNDVFLRRFNESLGRIFNLEWLINGNGDMLADQNQETPIIRPQHVGIRLVSQYAYGGYLTGYGDSEYLDNLPVIDFMPDRNMTGNYLAFEVRGDSMDDGTKDGYEQGEILICREVEPYLWRDAKLHINRRDFVIVHAEGILIKRIISHDVDAHTIVIHSLNPTYEDRTINLADVRQIFSVVESRRQRAR